MRLLATMFAHDEDGVSALCAALACFEVEIVAIERPDGVLVERLLESGVRVLALHPNQVKAARDRFRASGGKSDRFDRFVLCELARTDAHRFRVLEPDSDETNALKALTRAREDLVAARVALANQLRAELERFWPGPIRLFSAIDSPISLSFLTRYPARQTPAGWARSGCGVPESPPLQQQQDRGAAARAAAVSTLWSRRRDRDPHAPSDRAAPDPHTSDDGPGDRGARVRDRRSAVCAPEREDLPELLPQPELSHLRRNPVGRDRRLPGTLPAP